jgi:2-oxoglutarate dehydrogenase E1 component
MTGESRFRTVIGEIDQMMPAEAKRVVLCSGKVYYDLLAERRDRGIKDVAILRLEQLYPFPEKTLAFALKPYAKAQDVVWCQEEPENMGGWSFVDRRIEKVLTVIKHKAKRPIYVGRVAAASPATGLAKIHAVEQAALVREALGFLFSNIVGGLGGAGLAPPTFFTELD